MFVCLFLCLYSQYGYGLLACSELCSEAQVAALVFLFVLLPYLLGVKEDPVVKMDRRLSRSLSRHLSITR